MAKFLHTAGAEETISFLSPKGYARVRRVSEEPALSPFPAGGLQPQSCHSGSPQMAWERGQGARPRSSPKQWQNERASPVPFPGEERSWEAAGTSGQVASSWLAT